MLKFLNWLFIIYITFLGAFDSWAELAVGDAAAQHSSSFAQSVEDEPTSVATFQVKLQNDVHDESPCHDDDGHTHHRCHMGHCGFVVSEKLAWLALIEPKLNSIYEFNHLAPPLEGLKRPPRS